LRSFAANNCRAVENDRERFSLRARARAPGQKQDSAAEEQLAERKTKLDAREKALDEREKEFDVRETALDERGKALAKNEKAAANVRPTAPDAQSQDVIRDPAGDKAERDGRTQQLPPDAQALIADPLQGDSEKVDKDRRTQERLAQSQHGPEQLQSQRQRKLEAIQRWQISGAAVSHAGEVPSSPPSPTAEATSPAPSPTPP